MIQGEVLDASGRPVAGARVMVLTGPGSYPDTALLTDDQGRFLLGLPGSGEYELAVRAEGYPTTPVAVRIDEGQTTTVRVRLTNLG